MVYDSDNIRCIRRVGYNILSIREAMSSSAAAILEIVMPLHTLIERSLEIAWVTFLGFWLAAGLFASRAVKRQSWWSRALTLAVGTMPYYLVFTDKLRYGPLAWRFVPRELAVLVAGVALTYA